MKIDRYTKVVLTVIALALVVVATRPVLSPTHSYAARSIEYKLVAGPSYEDVETKLKVVGKEGWDVAGVLDRAHVLVKR